MCSSSSSQPRCALHHQHHSDHLPYHTIPSHPIPYHTFTLLFACTTNPSPHRHSARRRRRPALLFPLAITPDSPPLHPLQPVHRLCHHTPHSTLHTPHSTLHTPPHRCILRCSPTHSPLSTPSFAILFLPPIARLAHGNQPSSPQQQRLQNLNLSLPPSLAAPAAPAPAPPLSLHLCVLRPSHPASSLSSCSLTRPPASPHLTSPQSPHLNTSHHHILPLLHRILISWSSPSPSGLSVSLVPLLRSSYTQTCIPARPCFVVCLPASASVHPSCRQLSLEYLLSLILDTSVSCQRRTWHLQPLCLCAASTIDLQLISYPLSICSVPIPEHRRRYLAAVFHPSCQHIWICAVFSWSCPQTSDSACRKPVRIDLSRMRAELSFNFYTLRTCSH